VSAAQLRNTIYGLSLAMPEPPEWIDNIRLVTKRGAPTKATLTVPMTMWSDWHWGETVLAEETGGANTYNMKVARERMWRLVSSTVDLAKNHMGPVKLPGIVVALGGDMISGGIHEELRESNGGTIQQQLIDVQDNLCGALTAMADTFGKVFVPCVVGNHGRTSLKPRAKGRAFESYEWGLYQQLERHFRNDKRFRFVISNETDVHFTVLGHRFLLTHGDSLGVKGGDGIIGAIGPIARGATKVGRSEAQIGRNFDTLLMGHWHTYIPRGAATPVIVNGALKGYDEYARIGLRVPYSPPSQALWFVHERHGITAQWDVKVEDRFKAGPQSAVPWVSA
jgi:predicted phosphodiesterase